MALFDKLLIANRGEIAVRVIRACRTLGIPSVAVYSDADREALHAIEADEAVRIGPPEPAESYLSIERLLHAARETGAQAVHPGYGFLSENADFARAVREAELTFIGPSAEAIDAMGDKARARTRMQEVGVPFVPGYQGPDDAESLAEAADEFGYPVLLKAAAGGGGRGMRIVWEPEDLPEEAAAARQEAEHAFGDGRLVLERYLFQAHHVEFQVLADHHGRTLHVFERECSIQRRHQKILEETPSPLLDPELRERMGAAAIDAAQAVGYENAGTVEFIVDPETRAFYFLEMNTRLQVEHPVTEMVTGLDLVAWQIRIAAGEALPYEQADLAQVGHAIECRLYAEDPASGFLPTGGRLLRFRPPAGPGVRVDSGVVEGDTVGLHYDPLIAKVIVHAEDRPAAIRRMQIALQDTVALGVVTNLDFLQDVLAHPEFRGGKTDTRFITRQMSGWGPQKEPPPEVWIAAAMSEIHTAARRPRAPEEDPYSPWRRHKGFRLGQASQ